MFRCVSMLRVEKPKVVVAFPALVLGWVDSLLAPHFLSVVGGRALWTSKQLEVKVIESCQMFWLPRVARRGRLSNFSLPDTMWNSPGGEFTRVTPLWSQTRNDSANWKLHLVVSKRSVWENDRKWVWGLGEEKEPWKCRQEEESEGREGSSQEVRQIV